MAMEIKPKGGRNRAGHCMSIVGYSIVDGVEKVIINDPADGKQYSIDYDSMRSTEGFKFGEGAKSKTTWLWKWNYTTNKSENSI